MSFAWAGFIAEMQLAFRNPTWFPDESPRGTKHQPDMPVRNTLNMRNCSRLFRYCNFFRMQSIHWSEAMPRRYSTVTLLARLRSLSTLQPRAMAA
jgi:hypothetical protein